MSKHRESLDIVADVLRAASGGAGITRIMYTANLSYKLVERYLKLTLSLDFLNLAGLTYVVTGEGQRFLIKYESFNRRSLEVQGFLKTLEGERDALIRLLLKKESLMPTPEQSKETGEIANENLKEICCIFSRIDGQKFCQELITLGFRSVDAAEIVSWVDLIFATRPAFLSGKSTAAIKACLAYIGGRVFSTPRIFTLCKISLFYHISPNAIQVSFKAYLKILQQAKPDLFDLSKDFRTKEKLKI